MKKIKTVTEKKISKEAFPGVDRGEGKTMTYQGNMPLRIGSVGNLGKGVFCTGCGQIIIKVLFSPQHQAGQDCTKCHEIFLQRLLELTLSCATPHFNPNKNSAWHPSIGEITLSGKNKFLPLIPALNKNTKAVSCEHRSLV